MPPPPPIPRSEYLPKLEVWVAFSNKGVCEPFIQRLGEKFDHNVYLEECVKKRLVPFIEENHSDAEDEAVIWADAQPVYFNKKTLAYLDGQDIKYVEKEDIPGNRVKCFTYFWNFLRNKVYRMGWHAKDEAALERRILHCIQNINMNTVARIANDTDNRIKEMIDFGEIKEWSDSKQNYTGNN